MEISRLHLHRDQHNITQNKSPVVKWVTDREPLNWIIAKRNGPDKFWPDPGGKRKKIK